MARTRNLDKRTEYVPPSPSVPAVVVTEPEKIVHIPIIEKVDSIVIFNREQHKDAQEILIQFRQRKKQLEELLDPQCKSAYASWQTALEQKRKYVGIVEKAESVLKGKLAEYEMEQERIREEEERKALDKAEKEKEKLLKKADEAREKGKDDLADKLEMRADEAVVDALAGVQSTVSHESGVYSQNDYDVAITDAKALFRAIASGELKIKIESILTWKLGGFKTYIKTTGETKIPGCLVVPKKRIQVSA